LFPSNRELRNEPDAAPLVGKFRAEGYEPEGITLQFYIAMQVWAEGVEQAGTLQLDAVTESLRTNQFDTLVGTIGFDAKGDVTGYEPFEWYIWRGGHYAPVDSADLAE
jgi:branched-chain amino acid transport system substrate-binding protein